MRLFARVACCVVAVAVVLGAVGVMADIVPPPPIKGGPYPLEGLSVEVVSGRGWLIFDGKTPAIRNAEHWVSGAMRIQTISDPSLGASRLTAGTREMGQGPDRYVATIESFSGPGAPEATGRFYEFGIVLTNKGQQPVTVDLLDATSKSLDARMLSGPPPAPGLAPRAFLIPGLGTAPTSLAKSFDGKLAVTLKPGEQTWTLLVFDLPSHRDGMIWLQVKREVTFFFARLH